MLRAREAHPAMSSTPCSVMGPLLPARCPCVVAPAAAWARSHTRCLHGAQVLSRSGTEPPSSQATAVPGQKQELCLACGGGSQPRPSAALQLLAGSTALRLGLLDLFGVVSYNMSRVIKILHLRRGSCQPHKSHLLCFTNETRAAGTVLITSSISFTLAWNFICMPTATGFHQQLTLSDRELNQTKADLLLTTSSVIRLQGKKK